MTIPLVINWRTGQPFPVSSTPVISASDYGAVGNGVADDTTALSNAIAALPASGGVVLIPAGTYKTSSTLTISKSQTKLIGAGSDVVTITCNSAATPVITVNASLTSVRIQGMTLTHSVTATSGGNGITWNGPGSASFPHIEDIISTANYHGLRLLTCDFGTVTRCITQKSISVGVVMGDTSSSGGMQWYLDRVLSQENTSYGFLVSTGAFAGNCTLGTWTNCATFANSNAGIALGGTSGAPIFGLRVVGGFYGQDGNSEVYLDSFGGDHQIVGAQLELCGTIATGPTLSTPASNTGHGVQITTNNKAVLVSGCSIRSNSLNGIYAANTQASTSRLTVSGCDIVNNGQALASNQRNGILQAVSGPVIVVGACSIGNDSGNTTQQYALNAQQGNTCVIGGSYLSTNTVAQTVAVAGVITVYSNI